MNNKELGEYISSKDFKKSSNELAKRTEEIIGAGADIVTTAFLGIPSYSLLKPFFEGIRDWKSRVELKQIAFFLKEFENLNQSERSEFSIMIQDNEDDFTERLFYYVSQLNDKKKAVLCGTLGVQYARRKIESSRFLKLIQIVHRANYLDLISLKDMIIRYQNVNEGRLDNFIVPVEMFTSKSIFAGIFGKDQTQLIWSLINLELAIQEVDLDKISNIRLARMNRSLDLDKLAKSLEGLKISFRFTQEAYDLYHHGLSLLD